MKIHLISYTKNPLKSIAAAILNIGIGRDIASLDEITNEEAESAFKDTCKGFLTSPLEFASFNFFWQDIPIFLLRELIRHRVGWSYAERSLRFFDATKRKPLKGWDWDFVPSIGTKGTFLNMQFEAMLEKQLEVYSLLKEQGASTQDARNIIGVWYPTALQTSCSYRALRDALALRLSSQAHPAWRKAAQQIKEQVTLVDSTLGEELRNICDIQNRCVWQSQMDRPCEDCIKIGRGINHIHNFSNGQCTCGERG